MKRLIAEEITHRDIPMQFGLSNNTYENMLIQNGEIENSKYTPEYVFESPNDNPEWRFKDQNN
jgi:hypothetical protein